MTITHGVECPNCSHETFAFEKYCHRCGADRWSHTDCPSGDGDA